MDPLTDEEINKMNQEYLETLADNGYDVLQVIWGAPSQHL